MKYLVLIAPYLLYKTANIQHMNNNKNTFSNTRTLNLMLNGTKPKNVQKNEQVQMKMKV